MPTKIILSIKPEFVCKIISGDKKYEFRKIIPKTKIQSVVVYSTMPEGKVLGEFKVTEIISKSPDELWELTKEYSGISKEFFDKYFENKEIGYAFKINNFEQYKKAKNLKDLIPSGVAPQSFCYI